MKTKCRKVKTYHIDGPLEVTADTLAGLVIKLIAKFCGEKAKGDCQGCMLRYLQIFDDFKNLYPICDAVEHVYSSMSDKRLMALARKIEQAADDVNHGYSPCDIISSYEE